MIKSFADENLAHFQEKINSLRIRFHANISAIYPVSSMCVCGGGGILSAKGSYSFTIYCIFMP